MRTEKKEKKGRKKVVEREKVFLATPRGIRTGPRGKAEWGESDPDEADGSHRASLKTAQDSRGKCEKRDLKEMGGGGGGGKKINA